MTQIAIDKLMLPKAHLLHGQTLTEPFTRNLTALLINYFGAIAVYGTSALISRICFYFQTMSSENREKLPKYVDHQKNSNLYKYIDRGQTASQHELVNFHGAFTPHTFHRKKN